MSLILKAQQYVHMTLKVGALSSVAYRFTITASPSTFQFPSEVIPGTSFPTDMLFEGPPPATQVDINGEINNPQSLTCPAGWGPLGGKTVTPTTPSNSVQFAWLNGTTIVATAMDITYSDAISIAMNRPPLEAGAYGVKYFDGSTGVEVWDGNNWIGMANIARYSGRPFLLTKEEKKQCIENILAGINTPKQSDQRMIASGNALALARHYATKMEKNPTGHKVRIHILNMCGFYLLARNLGVSFTSNDNSTLASTTDKNLLAWAYQDIAKSDCDRIEAMLDGTLKRRADLQSWLKDKLA
ncbi:hypothetical protein [Solimicrobium silvestre]|uniref:Uncharacterized protein n=1 Tax=Solimicrobium silvestre TaxID=2099400 RepID=A0A2S9GXR8_9BURK|nr:hypothetical protein [Solimicrobium silvestre]PRC92500.1 hypothetical protein S2091_2875 [Solimicrobium silvestre]